MTGDYSIINVVRAEHEPIQIIYPASFITLRRKKTAVFLVLN